MDVYIYICSVLETPLKTASFLFVAWLVVLNNRGLAACAKGSQWLRGLQALQMFAQATVENRQGFLGDVCETKMDRSKEQQVTWEGEICLTRGQRFVFFILRRVFCYGEMMFFTTIPKYYESGTAERVGGRDFSTCDTGFGVLDILFKINAVLWNLVGNTHYNFQHPPNVKDIPIRLMEQIRLTS